MKPLYEGARVQTAKGFGTVHKVVDEVSWDDGKRFRKSLVVVQLDDRPRSAMRSVFYADRVKVVEEPESTDDYLDRLQAAGLIAEDDVEVDVELTDEPSTLAENQAEALEVERHQEAKHGDPED